MTRHHRTALACIASAALLLAATACSGSGDAHSSSAQLSYGKVKSAVQGVGSGSSCPLGIDLAAGLKAGGVERAVAPAGDGGKPVVARVNPSQPAGPLPSGFTPTPAMTTLPAKPEFVEVLCAFTAGTTPVQVFVVAVPAQDTAVSITLPYLQKVARLGTKELFAVYDGRPSPGQARTLPGSDAVAYTRVAVADRGDLALIVSQGTKDGVVSNPDPELTGPVMQTLAAKLAAQLHA
ncbi:hypothetical protein ACWGB8_28815 [Kitasatospora sp. NPDC054939]